MSKKKTIWIIVIIILLLLLGVGAWWFFYKGGKEKLFPQTTTYSQDEGDGEGGEEGSEEVEVVEGESQEGEGETEVVEEGEDETANWSTYTNTKYDYSFKYPPNYTFGPCTTKPCGNFIWDEMSETTAQDYVLLQGTNTATEGWPNFSVTHYSTNAYNPPNTADFTTWVKNNFPEAQDYAPSAPNYLLDGLAVLNYTVPASPQAYSSRNIFLLKNGKIFHISALDVETQEAQDFYDNIISTFQFNN